MNDPGLVDGVRVQWGDRLFYPGNRRVPASPGRTGTGLRTRAAVIRQRIEHTVARAPQVMVKVTGGGRGMVAIAAHLRYISKNGRILMEDDQGNHREGKEALLDVADQWRLGGSRIPEKSERREAFNIMLSMPRGTDPLVVQRAAREFAQTELADHRYGMVLHDHQANPHVHLSVRAESRQGKRLNPRKADLQRWREVFAERLRAWGIEAEATRQVTRGEQRNYPRLWRKKASEQGRVQTPGAAQKSGQRFSKSHEQAFEAWLRIKDALAKSSEPADHQLANAMNLHIRTMPFAIELMRRWKSEQRRELPGVQVAKVPTVTRSRPGPEMER